MDNLESNEQVPVAVESKPTSPQWVPLEPSLFPEGSVGRALFTEAYTMLQGRKRPPTIFQRHPYRMLLQPHSKRVYLEYLRELVEDLAVTPHGRLLYSIFGEEQQPVSPSKEEELMRAVEAQLATLSPREAAVLGYRFGLKDGIRLPLETVGALPEFNITRYGTDLIEVRALRKLRHESRRGYLRPFTTFPKGSLGQHIFGPMLRRDLPTLPETINDLTLSPEMVDEMVEKYHTWEVLELLRMPSDYCSKETIGEISRALKGNP